MQLANLRQLTLTVEAGGWWVRGPDGTGRGVSAGDFTKLYEHLDGDTYQRRGVVLAVQLGEETVVHTTEGPDIAAPGRWLVTDNQWNQWAVPDDQFRRSYTPDADQ